MLITSMAGIIYLVVLNFPASTEPNTVTQENSALPAAKPKEDIGTPIKFEIPVLGVSSDVQNVGLTKTGNMGTPSGPDKYRDIAWFKIGPRPGQEGSAVVAGHLDNGFGLEAVFYNLNQLKAGDEVIITTDKGERAVFRVLSQEIYDYKNAPTGEIFNRKDGRALLNLITCDGTWIKSEKSYDKRLVVFTEMISVTQ